jgi:uncharacterized damage-inducible protein DinB
MLPPLRRRFDRLERQRAELLADIAGRTDAALHYRPTPDSWSILQVIEHLVLAEESILALAARRGPKPVPFMERLRTGVRLRALYLALASNRRFRVPLPTLNPSGAEIGLEDLERRWTEARWQLARALEVVTRETASARPVGHPITRWLTWQQGLDFLYRHIARHTGQIRRIEQARAAAL